MKKFRTSISVTIMIFAAIGGYLTGATANEPMGGAILFAMIAGLACIVYAIDNQGKRIDLQKEMRSPTWRKMSSG